MNPHDDELTPQEKAALESLRVERAAPPELEERVVAGLHERGLLHAATTGESTAAAGRFSAVTGGSSAALLPGGWVGRLAAAAMLIALVGGAFLAGQATRPRDDLLMVQPTEQAYAFLVYQAPEAWLLPASQQAYDETSRWIGELVGAGVFEGGAQLQGSAALVSLVDGTVMPAGGPPADATRVMSGFLLITAPDMREAQRIAASSPLLQHGYSIEIREIIPD